MRGVANEDVLKILKRFAENIRTESIFVRTGTSKANDTSYYMTSRKLDEILYTTYYGLIGKTREQVRKENARKYERKKKNRAEKNAANGDREKKDS